MVPMKRLAMLAVLVVAAGVAGADPYDAGAWRRASQPSPVWYDFGFLVTRLDVGLAAPVNGELVRFGPRANVGPHVYIGGELDAGRVSGDASVPGVARTTGGQVMPTSSFDGTFGAVKGVVGAHASAGSLSGGAELAAGIRHASLSTLYGTEVAVVQAQPVVEAHARLDLWLSQSVTVGALAGVDLSQHQDVTFGVVFGLHLPR